MATAPAAHDVSPSAPERISSVVLLQRLEGFAAAAVAAVLYAHTGASWRLFAVLWLVPDLSMLGYLASPCTGARVYNAYHNYFAPIVLALGAMLFHLQGLWLPIALIWINHIGVDRTLGYGLKYGEGFGYTHLGRLGKKLT
jgi:hypothetical protein